MQLDDIQIEVGQPQQRSEIGGVNKYFVYPLKGKDSKGEIALLRRYSDFNLLREILVKRWPGCYIPSLPEKKTIGSSEHIFVEGRRRGLQIFLQTLVHSEAIWNSQQVQIFLKNSTGDTEKLLSPLLKQGFDKILARYMQAFPDYHTGEVMKEAAANISQFSSYLKESKIFLEKLNEQTQKMYDIYNNSVQKKLAVIEFLLPDYQKNCLVYNDEKKTLEMLFLESQRYQIKEKIDNYKKVNEYPPILLVSQEIRREKRQIQAFEEGIRGKNEIQSLKLKATAKLKDFEIKQSKINAGKQSIFSMLTKQSKQSQLAENKQGIQAAKAEQTLYNTIYQILSNLIGTKQIYKFKQLRQKAYYNMLKTYANMEKELVVAENDIWLATQNHDWVGENIQKDNGQQPTEPAYSHEQKQQQPKVEETHQQYPQFQDQEQIKADDF